MRKTAVILIVIFSFLQTGCWNAREINELAFVLSIGIDKAEDGFKVTAQIASPETYSKTPSGTAAIEKEKPFWMVSSTGKTIFEAIRNMASISSRRIFWSHIKVIIIGEQLARSNTLEIFDFFSRNPELRLRTLVAVTPEEAGKVLEVVPKMDKDPAIYLEKIIENRNLTGKSYGIMLKDFLEDYLDPNVGPVTSRIILDKSKLEPALKTSGAYVFDGDKLTAPLKEETTRGLLWIRNKMNDSIMVVDCPYDDSPTTLEIKKAKSSFKSYLDNEAPHFTINLNVEAVLTEQSCLTDFNDKQKLGELEKALESDIRKDIESTIAMAKDLQVDFLGLSRIMHRQHRSEWNQISSNWNKLFRNTEVTVAVKVDINHVSLAKPLEPIKTQDKNVQ
ncbi:Ger(x)C family spore germination protein [Clostridium magnum]|uniref:Spore germination protein B3 n=1 Tax=Clostridium magnum DSM 2767 TaxID=1121326 RepID=A0A162TAA8_9CLOT|nr:Ger(x)C family spore germination protein [Clostridium magnum]KZL92404.1 spore germination protein B3 precursor [Clostridium magnum DSM 2767]SHH10624.1 spore germination protein KC [Clostridium magnum DSM 2767]